MDIDLAHRSIIWRFGSESGRQEKISLWSIRIGRGGERKKGRKEGMKEGEKVGNLGGKEITNDQNTLQYLTLLYTLSFISTIFELITRFAGLV